MQQRHIIIIIIKFVFSSYVRLYSNIHHDKKDIIIIISIFLRRIQKIKTHTQMGSLTTICMFCVCFDGVVFRLKDKKRGGCMWDCRVNGNKIEQKTIKKKNIIKRKLRLFNSHFHSYTHQHSPIIQQPLVYLCTYSSLNM